jgi:hypothetical protein
VTAHCAKRRAQPRARSAPSTGTDCRRPLRGRRPRCSCRLG